jgi:SAM-dependent methyltransferase
MIAGFFPATTMPDADWWQALWPDPAKILAEMGVEPGIVAVDLCCGDGRFTVPLARSAKRVFAIDIDPVMLERTRMRIAAAGGANCEFLVADAMTVDQVVPEPVDYVFLANTFHGVPDQIGLARAVAALRLNSRETVDAARPSRRAISRTPKSRASASAISSRSANAR